MLMTTRGGVTVGVGIREIGRVKESVGDSGIMERAVGTTAPEHAPPRMILGPRIIGRETSVGSNNRRKSSRGRLGTTQHGETRQGIGRCPTMSGTARPSAGRFRAALSATLEAPAKEQMTGEDRTAMAGTMAVGADPMAADLPDWRGLMWKATTAM